MTEKSAPDHILIIDDDEQVSDVISLLLENEGFAIHACTTPAAALAALSRQEFMAVLLDIRLGEFDGVDLLRRIREIDHEIPIFMITAHGELDSAVKAFTFGATGYLRKPFQGGELRSQLVHAVENYRLKQELRAIKQHTNAEDIRSIFKTRDPALDPLLKQIAIAASVTSNVLIQGETGTGKEVVARALHQCGPRAKAPFIAFNCAAVPDNLIEAELFGFVRGAFTDARENKQGLFVRANEGTLFIDEIGDASASIQAKLLRVLQEKEVIPLGGVHPIPVNVRLVSATHRKLEDELVKGRFRQDLFYRLHVIPLMIPPLRDRRRDILFLASLFGRRYAEQLKIRFDGFSPSAQEALVHHSWPGNVRELQNRIERALVLGHGATLTAGDLFSPEVEAESAPPEAMRDAETTDPAEPLPSFGEAKSQFERGYLERVLEAARGNIAEAARLASKSRTEVYGLIRKHRINPDRFRKAGPFEG
ncbi:MAG: hypothetical protein A2428_08500 [Bdellovibrionales bacterium RIFOXYC1_FULL_54_43]|nr:MAG: hypothetical protein A2428_08500 [Bdellovibrionales bacterium RIFOXYC1_FULL_54_43]OFZ80347.1 MAG: hypothetical protein A2603_13265 [Bdellovibrionales bacterium RIFOXYD1_FULL_55_31]